MTAGNLQLLLDALPVDYGYDHYFLSVEMIDDAVTVNDHLTNILIIKPGTFRPLRGNCVRIFVRLTILRITTEAYAGESAAMKAAVASKSSTAGCD